MNMRFIVVKMEGCCGVVFSSICVREDVDLFWFNFFKVGRFEVLFDMEFF